MPRFHHANLGVPPGMADAEGDFLVDILGYRRVGLTPDANPGSLWYEGEDGRQIHLSEDPEHRPAVRAHVAVDFGDQLAAVEDRLGAAGIDFKAADRAGGRTALCRDPAGNLWELRRDDA